MGKYRIIIFVLIILLTQIPCNQPAQKVSLKEESYKTMKGLVDALLKLQIVNETDPDYGALQCPSCKVLHTRAAEAVYPFSVAYKYTGDKKYLKAAIDLGNWLIRQQLSEGEWKETPEEWTGTTTDQLLMMVLAFDVLKNELTDVEREAWITSMYKAADYLTKVMDANFASINYCSTTMATLAMMNHYFPNKKWAQKAKALAREVASKMDDDGFICAEGDRAYGVKYGTDVGYEIDMSLWGMGLYAKLMNDTFINELVKHSLKNHLYFVYPNGSIDGSWGIRSNKWTTYGSKTADGCQILFSMFAHEDARYRTAAIRNLEYLRTMINDGIIGYGPHYLDIFEESPCIYPTFVRSKNLAMTAELGEQEPGVTPPLPTEEIGWVRYFPTVDITLVRTKNFMTTISAYRYKELKKRNKSKYMHRPTGGSICNLWVEDHGFLQISSQTEYHRWEPMHFPDVEGIFCLTPRIEFENENGYFTNLYEFDSRLSVEQMKTLSRVIVSASGELSDHKLYPGGVAYTLQHTISDDAIEKMLTLRYHDGNRDVKIVEPIVQQPGMKYELIDNRNVRILGEKREFRFEVLDGNVKLELGKNESKYWAVFPSVKCYPIVLLVQKPEQEFKQKITYRIRILK